MYMFFTVSPPELSSQTARMYYFNTRECEKIEKTIALHKNKSNRTVTIVFELCF